VPIYEYECTSCEKRFELKQKMTDPTVKTCDQFGCAEAKPVNKIISAPAIMFKGSGWYVTDYSDKLKEPDAKSENKGEKTEVKSEATQSDSKGSSEGKASGDSSSSSSDSSSSSPSTNSSSSSGSAGSSGSASSSGSNSSSSTSSSSSA
jgi:putative FmdB family regulatory protein